MSRETLNIHQLLKGKHHTPETATEILNQHLLPALERYDTVVIDFNTPFAFTHPIPFLENLLGPLFMVHGYTRETLLKTKLGFLYPTAETKKRVKRVIQWNIFKRDFRASIKGSESNAHH